MKNTFRVVLLMAVAGAALPQIVTHGQSGAPQTSPRTTAKLPAPKPATPPAAAKPASPPKASSTGSAALVAQGKSRFQAYGCVDCHGEHGEGTDDGPDLISTTLNASQITAVLNKPSVDAQVKGMPTIAPTSPDLKPLVAYVLSLKSPKKK